MRGIFFNKKKISTLFLIMILVLLILFQMKKPTDSLQPVEINIEQKINPKNPDKLSMPDPVKDIEKPDIVNVNNVVEHEEKDKIQNNETIKKYKIYAEKFPQMVVPPLSDENSVGPGEGGEGYPIDKNSLSPKDLEEYNAGYKSNSFNQFSSDRISVRRFIKNTLPDGCKLNRKPVDLPKTSVIICFHNEAWSALIRSIHSIIDRSDPNLLEEIILVDDASTMVHLKEQLDEYIKALQIVKVLRQTKRQGLVRSRLAGTAIAKGAVLTFLDSHIECMPGWLEPLLTPIKHDYSNVVAPVIISINDDTLRVSNVPPSSVQVGGFTWSLVYTWHVPPQKDQERSGAPFSPISTPTIAGGLFAIHADFFRKIGYYDSGFEVWGAENLEISFNTWMCHGHLLIIPCSQVGHIFRKTSPYKWESAFTNPLRRNNNRLAEVWLDEYKKYYYERAGPKMDDIGDISSRLDLRVKNDCHNFTWYLDNIYPDIFDPAKALLHGRIRNPATGTCIDSGGRKSDSVIAYGCHQMGGNQAWYLSKNGEIRQDEKCFDVNAKPSYLALYPCHGQEGFQKFTFTENGGVIESNRGCLEVSNTEIILRPCNPDEPKQAWIWESEFF